MMHSGNSIKGEDSVYKITAVANTWADHFKIHEYRRQAFIDNYVSRVLEKRFWFAKYKENVLCRLGSIILLFDGSSITTCRVGHWRKFRKRDKLNWVPGVKVPNEVPISGQVTKISKAVKKRGSSGKDSDELVFLSTFFKTYKKLARIEVEADCMINNILYEKSPDCRYTRPRMNWYSGIGAHVLKKFNDELPQDPLKLLRSIHFPSIRALNWILAGDQLRRVQAIRAYPLLLPTLLLDEIHIMDDNEYSTSMTDILKDLGSNVDQGVAIASKLADIYSCSVKSVKSLSNIKPYCTGSVMSIINRVGYVVNHDALLRPFLVGALLGNKRPTCKEGWTNWTNLYRNLPIQIRRSPHEFESFLAGMPDLKSKEWKSLINKVSDISDLSLNEHYYDEHHLEQDNGYLERFKFYDSLNYEWPKIGLKTLLKLSHKWHEHRAEKLRELVAEADQLEADNKGKWFWMRMTERDLIHEPTKIQIVELNTPDKLVAEAFELNHCVDSYSDACFSGRSRIVSFKLEGKSLATAEYRLKDSTRKSQPRELYCTQLRGFENDDVMPGTPVALAFKWFTEMIVTSGSGVTLDWPVVPHNRRPGSDSGTAGKLCYYMEQWLRDQLGIETIPIPE